MRRFLGILKEIIRQRDGCQFGPGTDGTDGNIVELGGGIGLVLVLEGKEDVIPIWAPAGIAITASGIGTGNRVFLEPFACVVVICIKKAPTDIALKCVEKEKELPIPVEISNNWVDLESFRGKAGAWELIQLG